MTTRGLLLISAALIGAGACAQGGEAADASPPPLPTTVNCADASALEEDAGDARSRLARLTGDRAKIIAGNRAKFLASLAAVAKLKCRTNAAEVDDLLAKALEVGRVAETTGSEYDAARQWTDADLIASDAIARLINQVPTPSSR